MKKAICYYRVSTNKQKDQRQEYSTKQYFTQQGFEIVETFRETISGSKRNKPELQKALDYIDANDIQYLCVSELSRLGRTNEVIAIIDSLTQKQVCVCIQSGNIRSLNDKFELDTTNNIVINTLVGIAASELHQTKYRVTDGRNHAILNKHSYQGGYMKPYGYDVQDKKYVINEEEAQTVRDILNMFLQGQGTVKIANYLNQQGIKTKMAKYDKPVLTSNGQKVENFEFRWGRSQVIRILQNRIYIGERTYNGNTLHQPELRIISDDLFNAVQMKYKQHQQSNGEFNFKQKYTYLIPSKMITCGCCNRHYSGNYANNVYNCLRNKYGKNCENDNIKLKDLEKFVTDFIVNNYKGLVFDNDSLKKRIKELQTEKKQYEQQQQQLIKQRERYIEMFAMGVIKTKQDLNIKVNSCDDQLETLEQNILKVSELISNAQMQSFNNTLALVNLDKNYSEGSTILDATAIQRLIKEIKVFKKNGEGSRDIIITMMNDTKHIQTFN